MDVKFFMDELKRKLSAHGNKLDNLAYVAYELSSFYKKIQGSEVKSIFPKEIYDELYSMPNDSGYTELTKDLKLEMLEGKLLKIINSIDVSTKSKKIPVPHWDAFTKEEKDKFKVEFHLGGIKIMVFGMGPKGMHIAYKALKVFILLLFIVGVGFICKIFFEKYYEAPDDYTKTTQSLINGYKSKLDFYGQKEESLNGIIEKEAPESKQRIRAESVLPSITSKIDSLMRVILPDLEIIKNSEVDAARRSRLNAYQQILKNY